MIWIEKYRPKTFNEMIGRSEITDNLKLYTLDTIPHLIIYGGSGYGKRTILLSLINHLYGNVSESSVREADIENKITIKFIETKEYIEVTPSEYGNNDKIVIQNLIKEVAQTRPILSLVGSNKKLKLIIIGESENLTKFAQNSLRRTVETYSPNFRIIMICNDLSKIIEPLRSRCFCLRVPVMDGRPVLQKILKYENFILPDDQIEEILKASNGNLRKGICIMETLWHSQKDKENKRQKLESPFMLEWEKSIQKICNQILKNRNTQTILEIRKEIYNLLSTCISPNIIFVKIFNYILKNIPLQKRIILSKLAIKYNERLSRGSKAIFHIEAFIVSIMFELNKA